MDIHSIIKQSAEDCNSIASVTDVGKISELLRITEQILTYLKSAMYPSCFSCEGAYSDTQSKIAHAAELLLQAMDVLQIDKARAEAAVCALTSQLPHIKRTLETDLLAAYSGDPAARDFAEIILAYPAFEAISSYRTAHVLYMEKIPVLPRLMTELAHRSTGIDIHPGATIGESFFIDHGTGVVIGETTVIGNHVKLYQGVTLGARSFESDENGNPVKGIKRHPNIGNNVTIYARATILGGDTYIGDNCVIGGNIWLTESVEADRSIIISGDRAYDVIKRS